jgi:hypothetical protein
MIWQTDLHERIRLNVDILYHDILKQDTPWRRWPFLPGSAKRKLLNGDWHELTLSNPEVPIDVGTYVLKIHLPTVMEDYFDLPLVKNFMPLLRFRSSAHTVFGRKKKDEKNSETGLAPLDPGGHPNSPTCGHMEIPHLKYQLRGMRKKNR